MGAHFWHLIPRWLTLDQLPVIQPFYDGGSTLYTTAHLFPWWRPILWWTLSEFMDLLGTGPGRAILARADATSPPGRSNTHAAKAVPAPGEIQGQDELRNLPRKVMIAGVLHLILYPLSLL